MGIDFNKLNPEEAQKIINALKDGRINDNEAKNLKLTKAEQEALNEAFSSGEVQIGDFILVNDGKSKDGKMQYTKTLKVKSQDEPKSKTEKSDEPKEQPGFWDKAKNKIMSDVRGYVGRFTDAWKNSSGVVDTAKSLANAAGENLRDYVNDYADNVEKGVAYITGSEEAGKYIRGMSAAGQADAILDAVEGDTEGLKNVAKSLVMTASAPIAVLSSCTDIDQTVVTPPLNSNDDIVAALEKISEKLDRNEEINKSMLKTLQVIIENEIKNGATLEEIKDLVGNSNDLMLVVIDAMMQGNSSLDDIKVLIGDNSILLEMVLDQLVEGNTLLTNIKNSMDAGNEAILKTLFDIKNSVNMITELIENAPEYSQQLEDIKNAISDGNATSIEIMSMINTLLAQVAENGDVQVDILAKLEEIENSNKADGEKLAAMLELLKNIDSTTQDINNKLDEIKNTITEINNKVENDPDVKAALDKLLELVSKNNDKADVTNQLLEKLISMYENSNISKDDIAAIINAINKNGEKIDATNQLLAKMQDQDEKFQAQVLKLLGNVGADYTDVLNKILDAVNNGNAKLDDVTKLLAKMQNQDLEFQENVLNAINDLGTNITGVLNNILTNIGNDSSKLDQITQLLAKIDSNIEKYGNDGKTLGNNILNAINKLGSDVSNISTKLTQILNVVNADKDTGKNIEALLNKVLANMDSNTAKIIDAIANIKIEGGGSSGNVDLTSIEAMLKELVELTKDNNNALTDINGKLDVIKVTQQAILDKINVEANKNDERYVKVDAFMKEVLSKLSSASGYDDTKLMEVLSKLSNMIDTRLEEILNAIKDHDVNVTVDVTGKVTCECNCGNPHEGILGDLEDALG